MENHPNVRYQRVQEEWHDLLREEAALQSSIEAHQSAIADDLSRLKEIQGFKVAFSSFYFSQDHENKATSNFEPGGPCPMPIEELREMEGYQSSLETLGMAAPGGYIHARTAGQWLIEAGIIEGLSIDEARMRLSKYMSRSKKWEKVEGQRGWFRYLRDSVPEGFSQAPGRDGSVTEQGQKMPGDGTNQETRDFDDSSRLS